MENSANRQGMIFWPCLFGREPYHLKLMTNNILLPLALLIFSLGESSFAQQSRPSPNKNTPARAVQPAPTPSVQALDMPNEAEARFRWRYPTENSGSKKVVHIRKDVSIILPDPKINFDFSKYPQSHTNLSVARKMYTDLYRMYIDAYQAEAQASLKIPKEFSPYDQIFMAAMGDFQRFKLEVFQERVLPPRLLKLALDAATVGYFSSSRDVVVDALSKLKAAAASDAVAVETKIEEYRVAMENKIEAAQSSEVNEASWERWVQHNNAWIVVVLTALSVINTAVLVVAYLRNR